MKARIVTLNLAGLERRWFEERESRVREGLAALRPDVVCFQEAAIRYRPSYYDQGRAIGEAIGLGYFVFSPYGNVAETMSAEQGGVCVVGRWPIRGARHRRLPPGHGANTDARVALFASFDCGEGELALVATHLSWKPEELECRLVQAALALDELGRFENAAGRSCAVLAGDLNARPTEPAVLLLRDRMIDAFGDLHPEAEGHTWDPRNPYAGDWPQPARRIDYVFCSRDARVARAEVVLTAPAVSDHYGLLVDLEWGDGA